MKKYIETLLIKAKTIQDEKQMGKLVTAISEKKFDVESRRFKKPNDSTLFNDEMDLVYVYGVARRRYESMPVSKSV